MSAENLKMFDAMRELAARDRDAGVAVLATVVRISGSAYRAMGARMLVLPDGQRIGSVSGGCIEGEIAKKGWWWTENGAAYLRRYNTALDADGDEYGLACNGSIDVLVERISADDAHLPFASPLDMIADIYARRVRSVIATVFEVGPDGRASIPQRLVLGDDGATRGNLSDEMKSLILPHMRAALDQRISSRIALGGYEVALELVEAPLQLILCGAGFDAVPVVRFAAQLGWRVVVCDGRADFATPQRFPDADRVIALRSAADFAELPRDDRTACVIMTHSHDQDSALLRYWLPRRLLYLGILGARSRTRQMLDEIDFPFDTSNIYAPAGLDIGAETPEEIALSIVAEIRACFAGRAGGPLRDRGSSIHVNYADSTDSASNVSVAL